MKNKQKKVRHINEYVILRDEKSANHEMYGNERSGYDTVFGYSLAKKSVNELKAKFPNSTFEIVRLKDFIFLTKDELRVIDGALQMHKKSIDEMFKNGECGDDEQFYAHKEIFHIEEKLKFFQLYFNF